MVQLLLEHGADMDAVNQCGDTPLHKAAYIGHEVRTAGWWGSVGLTQLWVGLCGTELVLSVGSDYC